MVAYAYRCGDCGPFDVTRPMGEAAAEEDCPECGGPARRVFTGPSFARTPRALARALAAQEKSAHEPEVVTRAPAARPPAPPADPRHARLPRP
ncbi:FmdB family zinc ribbon protein [Bailinhaonella thermotolerans]|uniref:Zinc ribbon domain-containing protein n=1 Tax=Bailinhaonella thermotolerans TaxID=1070861 RepID=A0A3A4ATK5_9ACTN|nr:FmdB family zinc ribbon protein [Bailinhaonella thermotolerans]RJL32723.1 zinc ribbon domain-containing protein [Bailinhaonella thermotolerans]